MASRLSTVTQRLAGIFLLTCALTCAIGWPLHPQAQELTSLARDPGRLNVTLTFPSRCMFGDFDAIDLDMQHDNKPALKIAMVDLLTGEEKNLSALQDIFKRPDSSKPEALAAWDKYVAKKRESLFASGASFVFDHVPQRNFALVVCKDSAGTGCHDKVAVDINRVLQEYETPRERGDIQDRVYFFQPIVVKGGEFLAFNKVTDESSRAQLQKLGLSEQDTTKAVTLQSLPVKSSPGVIQIELPRFNKEKCGQ